MNTRHIITGVLAVAAVTTPLAIYANVRTTSKKPEYPIFVHIGLDASGSHRQLLPGDVTFVGKLNDCLKPSDTLEVDRVDCDCEPVYSGPPPDSGDKMTAELVRAFYPNPPHPGTAPRLFWNSIARSIQAQPNQHIIAILASDGDDDEMTASNERDIRLDARVIAEDPNAKIYILGVNSPNWSRLASEFSPVGPRLHIIGASFMSSFKPYEITSSP